MTSVRSITSQRFPSNIQLLHGLPVFHRWAAVRGLVVFEEGNHVCFNIPHNFRPLTADARLSGKKIRNQPLHPPPNCNTDLLRHSQRRGNLWLSSTGQPATTPS